MRLGGSSGLGIPGMLDGILGPLGIGGASALYLSLVSMWEFESLLADSVATNTLTNNNTVTQTTGKVGQSASFASASSQFLSRASNTGLQGGNRKWWTGGWMKATTVGALAAHLWGKGTIAFTPTTAEWVMFHNVAAFQHLQFGCGDGTNQPNVDFGAFSTGTWYFLLGWNDPADNKLHGRLNGGSVLDSTAHNGNPNVGSNALTFGARPGGTTPYNGLLDQVMWGTGYIPTAADASWLYNSGAGRSYTEIQSYAPRQIVLWDFLDRLRKRFGRVPVAPVKRWLPRIPAALRGRRSLHWAGA